MTITRVGGQATGTYQDNGTSITLAFPGGVTTGNLIIVGVARWSNGNDPFQAGDCAKSAGNATIDTPTLDVSINHNTTGTYYIAVAIYSALVTGEGADGSLTITVSGGPAGSYWTIGLEECASDVGWDDTRLEDLQTGENSTGTPAITASGTSVGAALFSGAMIVDAVAATTITPDVAFTQIYENENASHSVGAYCDRIVSSGTTDAAEWSLNPSDRHWAAVLAVYREIVAGGVSPVPPNILSRMKSLLVR